MCRIVGHIGNKQARPILLNALAHLEYRGYDSSGIAVRGDSVQVYKDKIRVKELTEKAPLFSSTSCISHTRWATHVETIPCKCIRECQDYIDGAGIYFLGKK